MNDTTRTSLKHTAKLRTLRFPNKFGLFICFLIGGLAGPAVIWFAEEYVLWYVSRYRNSFAYITVLPSLIGSGIVAHRINKHQHFQTRQLFESVSIGFVYAVIFAPITLALISAFSSIQMALFMIPFSLIMGWFSGIIPYMALVYGLPCAIILFFILFGMTKVVTED